METSNESPRRRCPFCAEDIKPEAVVCRWCNRSLTSLRGDIATDDRGSRQIFGLLVGCIVAVIVIYVVVQLVQAQHQMDCNMDNSQALLSSQPGDASNLKDCK